MRSFWVEIYIISQPQNDAIALKVKYYISYLYIPSVTHRGTNFIEVSHVEEEFYG